MAIKIYTANKQYVKVDSTKFSALILSAHSFTSDPLAVKFATNENDLHTLQKTSQC